MSIKTKPTSTRSNGHKKPPAVTKAAPPSPSLGVTSDTANSEQLVRGCLMVTEGQFYNKEDGKLDFMFNPNQYTISKSNNWKGQSTKNSNVAEQEFGGGEPRQIQMELFFDTYLPRAGVSRDPKYLWHLLNRLFNMMEIDKGLKMKGKNSKMSRPPKCRVVWGENTKNTFDCYLKSCQVKYTLFNPQGYPVRATANLTMIEARDPKQLLPTNPTSLGDPGRQLWVVHEGDRLDWIAYQEYGSAGEWRSIAEANNIVNPLDLYPGMVLLIPPR